MKILSTLVYAPWIELVVFFKQKTNSIFYFENNSKLKQ